MLFWVNECSFLNDMLDLNTGGHPLYFNPMHQCIKFRPSLGVQCLRLWASTAGARVRSLVGELRSQSAPHGEAKNQLQKTNCVRLSEILHCSGLHPHVLATRLLSTSKRASEADSGTMAGSPAGAGMRPFFPLTIPCHIFHSILDTNP